MNFCFISGSVVLNALFEWFVFLWEWLATEPPDMESRSTTARNIVFVVGGVAAIGIAIWRGVVADRQAKASQDQAKASHLQAETSQRSLLNERYQKGAEMLGSNILAVRLGGIYTLHRLDEEEPQQYHVLIMGLLSAFVRNPPPDTYIAPSTLPREILRRDVLGAIRLIGDRSDADVEIEEKEGFRISLAGVILSHAILPKANLTNGVLFGANLTDTNLTDANLTNANLTDVNLTRTNLTGANLANSEGLTQDRLDQALADLNSPPKLENIRDAKTGDLLRWRGGSGGSFQP